MRRWCAMVLLLAMLAAQPSLVRARKRNRNKKNINTVRRECERNTCAKEHEDVKENWVCLSCDDVRCSR